MIGARHQCPLIGAQAHALDIGMAEQIGGRLARRDALFDEREDRAPFLRQKPRIEPRIDVIDRQPQAIRE